MLLQYNHSAVQHTVLQRRHTRAVDRRRCSVDGKQTALFLFASWKKLQLLAQRKKSLNEAFVGCRRRKAQEEDSSQKCDCRKRTTLRDMKLHCSLASSGVLTLPPHALPWSGSNGESLNCRMHVPQYPWQLHPLKNAIFLSKRRGGCDAHL